MKNDYYSKLSLSTCLISANLVQRDKGKLHYKFLKHEKSLNNMSQKIENCAQHFVCSSKIRGSSNNVLHLLFPYYPTEFKTSPVVRFSCVLGRSVRYPQCSYVLGLKIPPKRLSCKSPASNIAKRPCKVMSLEEKIDIIQCYNQGQHTADIV